MRADENLVLHCCLQVNVECGQDYDNYQECLGFLLQTVYGECQVRADENLVLHCCLQVNVEWRQLYDNYEQCLRVVLQTV